MYTNHVSHFYWNHQDLLGEGGFGKVFKAHDLTKVGTPEELVAVKLMKYNEIHGDPTLIQLWKNESQCIMTLKGDYVANALEIIDKQPPNIFVVARLCDGGDLRKVMNKRNGQPFPETEALKIFKDMLNGMKTIVDHGYVHRDLKPENTFITKGKYQIADFGFCQIVKPGQ